MTRSCSRQAVWSKRSTLDYIEMNWVEFSWVWRIVRCIDPPPSSWKTLSIPLLRMKAEALSHRTPAVQYMSTYMFVENHVVVQRKRYDGTDQQVVITQSVSHSVYQSVSTSVSHTISQSVEYLPRSRACVNSIGLCASSHFIPISLLLLGCHRGWRLTILHVTFSVLHCCCIVIGGQCSRFISWLRKIKYTSI